MSIDTPHYYKSAWKISPSNLDNPNKTYIPSYMREGFNESQVIKLPQNIFAIEFNNTKKENYVE